jgi:hypothetical protein
LEQENEILRRAAAYLSQASLPGKDSSSPRTAGVPMAERTAWRICTDDRVERDFSIDAQIRCGSAILPSTGTGKESSTPVR